MLLLLAACNRGNADSAPEFCYVTNGHSDSVSVIDARPSRGFAVVKTIAVGHNPTGITLSPTRRELYVVNTESNNISFIDPDKNLVLATVGLHRAPFFVSVSSDGKRGYVANSGSANVSVLDLAERKVIATISVGGKPGVAEVSPDGKTVVVSNFADNSVSIIDANALRVRSTLPICSQPGQVAIMPDSSKAFVVCSGSAQVAAIALKTDDKLKANKDDALLAKLDVGQTPVSLALKPDGGELFVMNYGSGTISVIETTSNDVAGSYYIGNNPVRGFATSDNSLLYVSNLASNSIAVYSINDGSLAGTVQVGAGPDAMALSTSGNFLFVADSRAGDVAVVRTAPLPTSSKDSAERSLLTTIPVGAQPNQMVMVRAK